MTTTTKSLEQKIQAAVEQLVREHLAACEAAASVAVRAAFERASQPPSKRSASKSTRSPARRRSPEELTALQERLYAAIRRHPGETMAVIGPAAGATAQELERPVIRLRQQGRVRSVGRRQATRYFPMGE
mgnify:CR=1 FL=1